MSDDPTQARRQRFRTFTPREHETWRRLFEAQTPLRREQIVGQFADGIAALGLGPSRIPELDEVNRRLERLTGFRGVAVEGLEGPASFFRLLAEREFPVGNFIRDASDLAYTPAPDVFHDLYGHLPFLADRAYADFCESVGRLALRYADQPAALKQFDRFFWFTIEFALVRTARGLRIFGAGIASSFGECAYALSGAPTVLPFDLERIRNQDFRIDQMQKLLFVLDHERQLYECLPELEEGVRTAMEKGTSSWRP
jgi:phenylalanine-4-hydroxylase